MPVPVDRLTPLSAVMNSEQEVPLESSTDRLGAEVGLSHNMAMETYPDFDPYRSSSGEQSVGSEFLRPSDAAQASFLPLTRTFNRTPGFGRHVSSNASFTSTVTNPYEFGSPQAMQSVAHLNAAQATAQRVMDSVITRNNTPASARL